MLTKAWYAAALNNTSKLPKKPEDLWTEQKPNVVPLDQMIGALKGLGAPKKPTWKT